MTRVRFAEQGGVIVDAHIESHVKLYRDEVPQVSGSLLGGDVVIQFVRRAKPPAAERAAERRAGATVVNVAQRSTPVPAENPHEEIQNGDYLEGTVAPTPSR